MQDIYNNVGILWTHRGEFEKAREWLERAERVYKAHAGGGGGCVWPIGSATGRDGPWPPAGWVIAWLTSIYYKIQVYFKLNLPRDKLIIQLIHYCQETFPLLSALKKMQMMFDLFPYVPLLD